MLYVARSAWGSEEKLHVLGTVELADSTSVSLHVAPLALW